MAAKLSARVQHIVEEAAELLPDERIALIEAIASLPQRVDRADERRAVIAEGVARVQAGGVATVTLDEVEQRLPNDVAPSVAIDELADNDREKLHAAIRRGLDQGRRGASRPIDEALAELRTRR